MKASAIVLLLMMATFGNDEIQIDLLESNVLIKGTSNMHDWEMEVKEFDITARLEESTIQDLVVKISTFSIRSGKSIMDDKTFEALNAKEYPYIHFNANELNISENQIKGSGTVSLAGVDQLIEIKAQLEESTNDVLKISGSIPLKMSDFNVIPPTAMFGELKTDDPIVIEYQISFNK